MRFILRILANSLAIYLAAYFIPGVTVSSGGDWKIFLICGAVLSLINSILKPILRLISLPLIIITLGLFSVIINIFVVWLLARFVPQLIIDGVWALLLTSVLVSAANSAVNILTKKSHRERD